MKATGSTDASIHLDALILGGGFAGVYAAKALAKNSPKEQLKIGLISDDTYLVFQPMLPEVAGASVSPRHIVTNIRHICPGIEFYHGEITEIELENKTVWVNAGQYSRHIALSYEHLAITLGADIDLSRIPGMSEHAFQMRNIGDAMALRAKLIERFEEANLSNNKALRQQLLCFTVVGGGYSGVETAGQILDFFKKIHKYYHNIDENDYQVVLVHSRDRLLPTLSDGLAEHAKQMLQSRGMKLVLGKRAKALTADKLILDDNSTIQTSTVVCTIGNSTHPLIKNLIEKDQLPNKKGRLVTDPFLRIDGFKDLWAAGDAAWVPKDDGGSCPATAQFAIRQGKKLGQNIARTQSSQPLKSFKFKGLGELATIGHHQAVAQVMNIHFSGFLAWWAWRTIYLSKLPGLERKLRVVIDWTMDLFFPRDINLLNPQHTHVLDEIHLEANTPLFFAGEPAQSLYIVKEGCIQIQEGSKLIKEVRSGDYFGEDAMLNNAIWQYNATATESSTVIALESKFMKPIVEGSHTLRKLFSDSAKSYLDTALIEEISEKLSKTVKQKAVSSLMSTNVCTLQADTCIHKAFDHIRKSSHSYYPILDETQKVLGALKKDTLYSYTTENGYAESKPLKIVEWEQLPHIPETTDAEACIETMLRSGKNTLLVCAADKRLKGIITIADLTG